MSQIRAIGESIAAHIAAERSGTVAEFEPVNQFQSTELRTAEVHWISGQAGTPDGDISLGGDTDVYTDRFAVFLYRSDGDLDALLADLQAVSLSLNYDWTAPPDVDYRRVMSRSVLRDRQKDGTMSPVRGVMLDVEVSYTESA